MGRPHAASSIGSYERRSNPVQSQSSRSRLRARDRSPIDRFNDPNDDIRFYRSRSPPRSPPESSRIRSFYRDSSRSGYTTDTRRSLNISLPKNFPKPLTCYFWFTNGRCSKRDVDCAYAHWNTGHLAGAPITVSTDTGTESVAGKKAQIFASDTYRPSSTQDDSREDWLQLREEEVTRRENQVAEAEERLRNLGNLSEMASPNKEDWRLGSNANDLSEDWICEECGHRKYRSD
ncbi:hypothetical protein DM02DRAFT_176009 [Periconia macrospinosa]|uniref:C3H1-type domain-containing protein n=1 Tax=Periconia macrospinosa TaxID=97972 RepID=A0A2V1E579_9PLEO|nr:hypothetical protein DM02DRAFT_176009 [Periconia macrospinosa]